MIYNNHFKMQDLLANPSLQSVFPQFKCGVFIKNVYSFAEVAHWISEYLINAFSGLLTGDGELVIKGMYKTRFKQISALKPIIEGFFNNIPSVAKNIRSNTKLYTTFATLGQIADIKSPSGKIAALKQIIDNINYNPDFNSQNSVTNKSPIPFQKRQENWKIKVGYKEG